MNRFARLSSLSASFRNYPSRQTVLAYSFLTIYCIVLACLLSYQPLWVDEILQLIGTRSGTLEHTEQLTRSGGVPLGWLPQLFAIHLFGYSVAVSRLPSALASVASCYTVLLIAKHLEVRYWLLAAFLLSLLPLHFRYALEGRPYSQGVLFSAVATLIFLKLLKHFSLSLFSAYVLILIAGFYSQPFTCFTACSHFLWTLTVPRQKRLTSYTGGAILLMIITFIPWYTYASPLWRQTIHAGGIHFHLSLKTPLMLLREITGAGYLGGCSLLVLAGLGLWKGTASAELKRLLVVCSIVPVIGVLMLDAMFDYFLAIRQMIFVLPPLALLAALGISALMCLIPKSTVGGTAFLAIVLATYSFRWLQKPREDWALAARVLQETSIDRPACGVYSPPSSLYYYTFFEPKLADSSCGTDLAGTVVLATSPYASEADQTQSRKLLEGKSIVSNQAVGMSTIQVLR